MRTRIGIGGLLLALGGPAWGQDFYSGDGKGTVVKDLGIAFRGAALLDGFYFRFRGTDHHFGAIELGIDRPFVNRLTAGFEDKNGDDRFDYALSFHPRFGPTALGSTGTLRGVGEITVPLQQPEGFQPIFVLRGFRIGFDDTDHHIQRLAVFHVDGELTVALEGGRGGFWLSSTEFRAQVDYAYVPRRIVEGIWARSGDVESGGSDEEIIARGRSVLSGFDRRFTGGDHHVQELGIWPPDDGRVMVFFGDKEPDDRFLWSAEGVFLEREPITGIDRPVPGLSLEAGRPSPARPSFCGPSCDCRAGK